MEGIKDLIVKVASEMKNKGMQSSTDIYPTVYSLCIIHACRNAKITCSNLRSLCVQWAKCGNEMDSSEKLEQMQKNKIDPKALNHMLKVGTDVTYLGLRGAQNLQTNYEVVRH